MTDNKSQKTEDEAECCRIEEKINKAEEQHSDDDGHDHDHSIKEKSTFQLFLPAIISFGLLMLAIVASSFALCILDVVVTVGFLLCAATSVLKHTVNKVTNVKAKFFIN